MNNLKISYSKEYDDILQISSAVSEINSIFEEFKDTIETIDINATDLAVMSNN